MCNSRRILLERHNSHAIVPFVCRHLGVHIRQTPHNILCHPPWTNVLLDDQIRAPSPMILRATTSLSNTANGSMFSNASTAVHVNGTPVCVCVGVCLQVQDISLRSLSFYHWLEHMYKICITPNTCANFVLLVDVCFEMRVS